SSGAIFDQTKLLWLSQQYMKTMDSLRLAELTEPFIAKAGLTVPRDRGWLARVVDTLKERAQTLVELVEAGRFYFERPREYEVMALPGRDETLARLPAARHAIGPST